MIVEEREISDGSIAIVGCCVRVGFLVGLVVMVGLSVMVGVRVGTSVAVGVHVEGKTTVVEVMVMVAVVVGCAAIFSGVCVGVAVQAVASKQTSRKKRCFDFMVFTLFGV